MRSIKVANRVIARTLKKFGVKDFKTTIFKGDSVEKDTCLEIIMTHPLGEDDVAYNLYNFQEYTASDVVAELEDVLDDMVFESIERLQDTLLGFKEFDSILKIKKEIDKEVEKKAIKT